MSVATILLLGFLLGTRHALEADHLAAVATLATRSRSVGRTVGLGVAWGMGHTLTLMLFGGAVLLLGLVVPEKAAKGLEFTVGVMLAILGANVLYRLWRDRIHFHWHRHGEGVAHLHAHGHAGQTDPHQAAQHDHVHWRWRAFPLRALMVGMVHGMAGSAALILLSLEAVDSAAWGLGYIAIFGAGSILGMALLSVAIAVPLRLTSQYLSRAYGLLTGAVGLATLALGCSMIYRFGSAAAIAGS
jgi:hypothetical protein